MSTDPAVSAHLIAWAPLSRLEHFPRYLRAAQAGQRAISDPRKDADKRVPFTPLWTAFLKRQASASDQTTARDLRWLLEELRVAIFAPGAQAPHAALDREGRGPCQSAAPP